MSVSLVASQSGATPEWQQTDTAHLTLWFVDAELSKIDRFVGIPNVLV